MKKNRKILKRIILKKFKKKENFKKNDFQGLKKYKKYEMII